MVKFAKRFEKAPSFVVHGRIYIAVQNFPKIVPISQYDVTIRSGTKDCCDHLLSNLFLLSLCTSMAQTRYLKWWKRKVATTV